MRLAAVSRVASLALAGSASFLLLLGPLVPGLLVGCAAVGVAWLRPSSWGPAGAAHIDPGEPAGRSTS